MILYEVNIRILAEAADEYAAWLDDHIRQILEIDGFVSAEWFEVEEDQETRELEEAVRQAVRLDESIPSELREAAAVSVDTRLFTVHYRLTDRRSLEHYLMLHADGMRRDGIERFGDKFAATRRVMKRVKTFDGQDR